MLLDQRNSSYGRSKDALFNVPTELKLWPFKDALFNIVWRYQSFRLLHVFEALQEKAEHWQTLAHICERIE